MVSLPATINEKDETDAVFTATAGNGLFRKRDGCWLSATLASWNMLASLALAAGLQLLLFPAYGLFSPVAQSLKAGAWFTLLFLVRCQTFGFLSQRPRRGHAK
jgi:hypothetical protein